MPNTRWRIARIACAIAVLTSVSAVCNPPLDIEGLEPQLLNQAETKTGQDFRSVSCPDDVQPEAGHQFSCEAVDGDGTTLTMQVTQIDDKGRVEWAFIEAAGAGPGT